MLSNGRNRHADFWLNDGPVKQKLDEGGEFSTEEYIRAKNNISQFVRIMAGRDIEVKFRDPDEGPGEAHTDGETVTIPSEVGENFDSTVGTALHEASHVVKSRFEILDKLQDGDIVPQDIIDKLEPKLKKSDVWKKYDQITGNSKDLDPEEQASRALHVLWNVVEDRWIDNWAYNKRPGYWGYYIQMYREHWHSDEVSKAFQYDNRREEVVKEVEGGASLRPLMKKEANEAPKALRKVANKALEKLNGGASKNEVRQMVIDKFSIKPDWNEYSFRITNITNSEWNPDVLPGLREIEETFDVQNIDRHDDSYECFETACDIFRIMLEHLEDIYVHPKFGQSPDDSSDSEEEEAAEEAGEGDDMPEELQDIMEDQLDHMEGESGEDIDPEKLEEVEFFEDSEVEEKEVGGSPDPDNEESSSSRPIRPNEDIFDVSVSSVFVGSVSESFLESNHRKLDPVSGSPNKTTAKAVEEGIEMGRILGNKLRVFDDERTTKYTRRRRGKLDDNLLAEITYSSRLFYTEETEKYKSGFLHISVDASGSMRRDKKFERAIRTAVALAQAASMIRNLRCQVSLRSTCRVSDDKKPLLMLAYDSSRDSMEYVKATFPYFKGSGTTPEGLAFETMKEEILTASQDKRAYFVNLSDGMPYFTRRAGVGYSGEPARNHTKSEVDDFRRNDISVLSYYIGSDGKSEFREMYGNDSEFIDVESVTSIRKTMNEKLLNQNERKGI